ncbi:glutaredoxin family protein [Candidatus Micrarchaeota archaeon]|nr:glutaredoxin family protein [Candidatus Micrarchaeota archaeon]
MADHKIVIYSTQTCPYCKMAKEYLKSRHIGFQDIDVGADQQAAEEMVKKSGQMGVPVIDIDGTIVVGFDKDAVDKALA